MRYLRKRPYRKKYAKQETFSQLIAMMDRRFKKGFSSYWEQFGYEIGGPVCYAYTRWIIEQLSSSYQDVSDIIFIARDGWILKQVYEKLTVYDNRIKAHYVYAPRSLKRTCQTGKGLNEYRAYIDGLGLGKGRIVAVDTGSMNFSGQKLIQKAVDQKVTGFYWVALNANPHYEKSGRVRSYQKQHYHRIRCWNLMEFIMTSPESPIKDFHSGKPEYDTGNSYENQRKTDFLEMEKGILAYIDDISSAYTTLPFLLEEDIREWVNDFLKHPDKEDKKAFSVVRFSEREDHSDDIPLRPFKKKRLTIKENIWIYSQKYPWLYRILHKVNGYVKSANR